jgi:hypothetical protein
MYHSKLINSQRIWQIIWHHLIIILQVLKLHHRTKRTFRWIQILWSMTNTLKLILNQREKTNRFRMSWCLLSRFLLLKIRLGMNWELKSKIKFEQIYNIKLRKRWKQRLDSKLSMKLHPRSLRESLKKFLKESNCKLNKRNNANSKFKFKQFKLKSKKMKELNLNQKNLSNSEECKN